MSDMNFIEFSGDDVESPGLGDFMAERESELFKWHVRSVVLLLVVLILAFV